jgi:hypothetical protein
MCASVRAKAVLATGTAAEGKRGVNAIRRVLKKVGKAKN